MKVSFSILCFYLFEITLEFQQIVNAIRVDLAPSRQTAFVTLKTEANLKDYTYFNKDDDDGDDDDDDTNFK